VLVTGVPGTGKSTVADHAGRLLGAAVLAHDWAMSSLRPYPELQETLGSMDPPGHRAVGWSILRSLARSELRRDRSVVLDGVAREPEVASCRELVSTEDAELVLVAAECSDAELHRDRVVGRRRLIPDWYELEWGHVATARETWNHPTGVDLVLDASLPWGRNAAKLEALLRPIQHVD
jgi:predicted kinase